MFCKKTIVTALIIAAFLLISVVVSTNTSNNPLTRLKSTPIAPDFTLNDMSGRQYALSDYRGKVVLINFWASWCPPCKAEMPSLQRAANKLAKHDISVLGIGVGENDESIRRFLKSTPISFPLLLDTKSEVMETWSAPSLPTTIVINPEGKITLLALGERDWDDDDILQQVISLKKHP